METLRAPFIFLLIPFVYPKLSSPILTCANNSFYIQYPFHLQQENHKPHPDPFILQCNIQGITVLRLPFSGEFYVRDIDYFGQKIRLYDQGNCLFGRLVNFSLSKSPFYAVIYQNYTFFSCPTELVGSRNLTSISCLSNSTASVYATSSLVTNLTGCSVIVSSQIPVSKIDQFEHEGFNGDLHLGWSVPLCDEDCKAKTQRRTVLSIIIGLLVASSFSALSVLFCVGCCLRFAGMITEINESNHQTSHTSDEGAPEMYGMASSPDQLSSATWVEAARQHEFSDHYQTASSSPSLGQLSSATWEETAEQHEFSDGFFTKDLIIDGGQCISGPNGDSCPICLEEFHPSARLRRLSKCDHRFHAPCLETWLEKKTTCPVCRNNVV
ncbi:putative RING-H2 finger protein ATL21A isoform X1 [Primulina tabacum]|uniref:putative RING-H2 finger protein ATL21A isoform X1 n=1 Tax=Primulina tabacum TaxID=48773 RepID=UPI003F5A943E